MTLPADVVDLAIIHVGASGMGRRPVIAESNEVDEVRLCLMRSNGGWTACFHGGALRYSVASDSLRLLSATPLRPIPLGEDTPVRLSEVLAFPSAATETPKGSLAVSSDIAPDSSEQTLRVRDFARPAIIYVNVYAALGADLQHITATQLR